MRKVIYGPALDRSGLGGTQPHGIHINAVQSDCKSVTMNGNFDRSICENLLTYKQAAQFLNVSESYLRRLKSEGKIPWVSIGVRGVRFNARSLRQWVEEHEVK